MRLIFFDFNINYGGGPQGSVYLAKRLAAGHEVHVIDAYGKCLPYCEAVKQAGLKLHVLQPESTHTYIGSQGQLWNRALRLLRQLPALIRLRAALQKTILALQPDVIWVNNEKSLFFLATSWRLRRYPIVVYLRGWATPDQVGPRFRFLLRHRVAQIMAHAEATCKQLIAIGMPPEKLHFAPNTVDKAAVETQSQRQPCPALPLDGRRPRLLLPAARPEPKKGHHTAIQALHLLKTMGHEPVLWLPGTLATGHDRSYLDRLEARIDELGLKENVEFLGWRTDMPALIRSCDVVILPTHTEGFPRVVLEAMLLQKPVCATPVGGIPEAVRDGETGLLFAVDDAPELAKSVDRLVRNNQLRDAIVARAYEMVGTRHDAQRHTRKVEEVLHAAAGRTDCPGHVTLEKV